MIIRAKGQNKLFFHIPTNSTRDLGIVLFCVGIFVICVFNYFENLFYLPLKLSENFSNSLAAILILAGVYFVFLFRKKLLIDKKEKKIIINDGVFSRAIIIFWQGKPSVKISVGLEQAGVTQHEFWQVSFLDDKMEFCIDRKINHQLDIRVLAENMAKFLECEYIDATEKKEGIIIKSSDLDLPFKERVALYPQLISKDYKKPDNLRFNISEFEDKIVYEWGFKNNLFVMELLLIIAFSLIITALPILPGKNSIFRIAIEHHDYTLYASLGFLISIIILIFSGYKHILQLLPTGLITEEFWHGIKISQNNINYNRLEEIKTKETFRGPYVQLITDKQIINLRMFDIANSRWLQYLLQKDIMDLTKTDS